MKAIDLFGKYRIEVDFEITENCVKRVAQLLIVGWKFTGQSTIPTHKELTFQRNDEVASLSCDGDISVDVIQPYETIETMLD